jgi:hypothetical protein
MKEESAIKLMTCDIPGLGLRIKKAADLEGVQQNPLAIDGLLIVSDKNLYEICLQIKVLI